MKIELTIDELKYIGSVLEQRPYIESFALIHKIQAQINLEFEENNDDS